jgi:hypothetical protein
MAKDLKVETRLLTYVKEAENNEYVKANLP